MEHAIQDLAERFANRVDIAQSQRRIAELPVLQLAADKALNELLNRLGRGVRDGAHRRLDGVRQHDDGALLRRRALTVIAEIGNINRLAVRHLQGFVVEVHHGGVAVMLHDNHLDFRRQVVFLRQRQTIAGMRRNNRGGYIWVGAVVRVIAHLVFLEVQRALEFPDVMEIRACARQQRIRADFLRRRFRQIRHHNRVVIRSGRFQQQTAQQRLIRVRQFQQLRGRGEVERRLEHGLEADGNQAAQNAARHRPHGVVHHAGYIVGGHQAHGEDNDHIHHRDNHARNHHADTLRLILQVLHGDDAGDDAREYQMHHFRRVGVGTARAKPRRNQRHGERGGNADARTQQRSQQHRRHHDRGKVDIHQLDGNHAQSFAQHQHHHDDAGAAHVPQNLRRKDNEHQNQHRHGNSNEQQRAEVDVIIIRCGIQQPQRLQHGELIRLHALALADDVLPLQVHHRLHLRSGVLLRLRGQFLVNDHVRADAVVEHDGHDVLHQRRFDAVARNLFNRRDGLADLPFADGGVQRAFHREAHRHRHGVEILRAGAHEDSRLIARERHGFHLLEGVVDFLRAEGRREVCFRRGFAVLHAQGQPVLLHNAQLAERLVEVAQHAFGHALLKVVGRFHTDGGFAAAAFGRHRVLHVLRGGNRLVRNRADAQAVALRCARRGKQDQQHQRADGVNERAFRARAVQPSGEAAQNRAVVLLVFAFTHVVITPSAPEGADLRALPFRFPMVVGVIRLDNRLHQLVADDVLVRQVHHADFRNVLQNFDCFR